MSPSALSSRMSAMGIVLLVLCCAHISTAASFGGLCDSDADCNYSVGVPSMCVNNQCTVACTVGVSSCDISQSFGNEAQCAIDCVAIADGPLTGYCDITSCPAGSGPGSSCVTNSGCLNTVGPSLCVSGTCSPYTCFTQAFVCNDPADPFNCDVAPAPECPPSPDACDTSPATCGALDPQFDVSLANPLVCAYPPLTYEPPAYVDPSCSLAGPCVDGAFPSSFYIECGVLNNNPCGLYSCDPLGSYACVYSGMNRTDDIYVPAPTTENPNAYVNCATGISVDSPPQSAIVSLENVDVALTQENVIVGSTDQSVFNVIIPFAVASVEEAVVVEIQLVSSTYSNDLAGPTSTDLITTMDTVMEPITIEGSILDNEFPTLYESSENVQASGCDTTTLDGTYQCTSSDLGTVTSLTKAETEECLRAAAKIELEQSTSIDNVLIGALDFGQNDLNTAIVNWHECNTYLGISKKRNVAQTVPTSVTFGAPVNTADFPNANAIRIGFQYLQFSREQFLKSIGFSISLNRTAIECTISRCTWQGAQKYCDDSAYENRWPNEFCGLTEQDIYEIQLADDSWIFSANEYLALRNNRICTSAFDTDPLVLAAVDLLLDEMANSLAQTCDPVTPGVTTPLSYGYFQSLAAQARNYTQEYMCAEEVDRDSTCPLTHRQLAFCKGQENKQAIHPAKGKGKGLEKEHPKKIQCEALYPGTSVSYFEYMASLMLDGGAAAQSAPEGDPTVGANSHVPGATVAWVVIVVIIAVVLVITVIWLIYAFVLKPKNGRSSV